MTCKTCGAQLGDDKYIVFCNQFCQIAHYLIVERKKTMNHPFVASQLNPKECATCKYDALSHSPMARCEACTAMGTCNIVDNMLLCQSCESKQLLTKRDELVTADRIAGEVRKELDREVLEVRNAGDFFNDRIIKKTQTIVALKQSIDADDSIAPEDKSLEFQRKLAGRYEHLSEVIFELDAQKQDAVSEKYAITNTLRELGAEIRAEVQARIKELDAAYTPIRKPVKVTMPKSKLSPFERIVQSLAQASGMTLEQARQQLLNKGIK